jgi:hypothetical protein
MKTTIATTMAVAAASFLGAAAVEAQTTAMSGRVVELAGPEVAIHLCMQPMPAEGALLEIGFPATANEASGSFGVWRVHEVHDCLLWVAAVCNTSMPAVGQSATVLMSTADVEPTPAPAPVVISEPPARPDRQELIAEAIDGLGSASSAERRRAAMALYRHYRYDVEVQQAAASSLLAGYGLYVHDWDHVDAMSWLCNILGASGDRGFHDILYEVARHTPSPKLRDYARKNLHRLR